MYKDPSADNGKKSNENSENTIHHIRKDRMWQYKTMVTQMDHSIGLLLQSLEKLGIDKETMVVFTSDNGPENGAGTAYPYKQRKRSLAAGGIKVPAIVQYKGTFEANTQSHAFTSAIDLFATFLEAASLSKPETIRWDAVSFHNELLEATAKKNVDDWDYAGYIQQHDVQVDHQRGLENTTKNTRRLYDSNNRNGYSGDIRRIDHNAHHHGNGTGSNKHRVLKESEVLDSEASHTFISKHSSVSTPTAHLEGIEMEEEAQRIREAMITASSPPSVDREIRKKWRDSRQNVGIIQNTVSKGAVEMMEIPPTAPLKSPTPSKTRRYETQKAYVPNPFYTPGSTTPEYIELVDDPTPAPTNAPPVSNHHHNNANAESIQFMEPVATTTQIENKISGPGDEMSFAAFTRDYQQRLVNGEIDGDDQATDTGLPALTSTDSDDVSNVSDEEMMMKIKNEDVAFENKNSMKSETKKQKQHKKLNLMSRASMDLLEQHQSQHYHNDKHIQKGNDEKEAKEGHVEFLDTTLDHRIYLNDSHNTNNSQTKQDSAEEEYKMKVKYLNYQRHLAAHKKYVDRLLQLMHLGDSVENGNRRTLVHAVLNRHDYSGNLFTKKGYRHPIEPDRVIKTLHVGRHQMEGRTLFQIQSGGKQNHDDNNKAAGELQFLRGSDSTGSTKHHDKSDDNIKAREKQNERLFLWYKYTEGDSPEQSAAYYKGIKVILERIGTTTTQHQFCMKAIYDTRVDPLESTDLYETGMEWARYGGQTCVLHSQVNFSKLNTTVIDAVFTKPISDVIYNKIKQWSRLDVQDKIWQRVLSIRSEGTTNKSPLEPYSSISGMSKDTETIVKSDPAAALMLEVAAEKEVGGMPRSRRYIYQSQESMMFKLLQQINNNVGSHSGTSLDKPLSKWTAKDVSLLFGEYVNDLTRVIQYMMPKIGYFVQTGNLPQEIYKEEVDLKLRPISCKVPMASDIQPLQFVPGH